MIGGALLFWATLFFLEVSKVYSEDRISSISALCEFVVHFFIFIALFQVFFKLTKKSKKIWKWLVLSNVFLLLMDISFELSVYFPKNYVLSIETLTLFSGYVPYIMFLLAFAIFLVKILSSKAFPRVLLAKCIVFFAVFNLVIILLFLSAIQYAFSDFSFQTLSHIISMTIEFIIFDLALISLIYSECRGFSILLIGMVVLMGGDFFINYSFLSQTSHLLAMGELLWFLGLMGILFGLWTVQKEQHFVLRDWFVEKNKIKNKLALWSFFTSITSFLIFFTLAYLFSAIDKETCLGLPLFIMGYSVIVVLASIFVGNIFAAPFKKLEKNVQTLMLENCETMENDFTSEEFISLNNFILNAHRIKEERDRTKKHLSEIASQVAHDIRSPISVMDMTLLDIKKYVPAFEYSLLNEAIQSVRDISNNLLVRYRESLSDKKENFLMDKVQVIENAKDNGNINRPVLLSSILELILSQKRQEWKKNPCDIQLNVNETEKVVWINAAPNNLKRLLSNLLNNAYEASQDIRKIILQLNRVTFNNDRQLCLTIKDFGVGIPADKVASVLLGLSLKHGGKGIGLSSSLNYMESLGGKLEIDSQVGTGTNIRLLFPLLNKPCWFPDTMNIQNTDSLVILDDDPVIHALWKHRFLCLNIKTHHFDNLHDFTLWHTENQMVKNSVYLVDYDFHNPQKNGMDVLISLKNVASHKKYLVTSHFDEVNIQKSCSEQGIFLLPKPLIQAVKISILS